MNPQEPLNELSHRVRFQYNKRLSLEGQPSVNKSLFISAQLVWIVSALMLLRSIMNHHKTSATLFGATPNIQEQIRGKRKMLVASVQSSGEFKYHYLSATAHIVLRLPRLGW